MALSDNLRGFLAEIQAEKTAAAKKAGSNTEAGSIGGHTTHPVKDVDDQTSKATEGARSAENAADVKEQIFNGGADGAPDKGPSQEDVQFNVGVTSTATGDDPANEDNFKDKKDDPGTEAPAKVDDNEKYGSMSFAQLKAMFEKNANALMAGVVAQSQKAPVKAAQAPAPAPIQAPAKVADKAAALQAANAGYDLAKEAAFAADPNIKTAIEQTIRNGLNMATMTGNYLRAYEKQALAKAAGEDEEGEGGDEGKKPEEGGDKKKPGGEASGDSSGATPSEGAIPGVDSGLLGDMSGGGGGSPEAGGEGGGGNTDAIQQILMAMMELGIQPDQIIAQLQGGGGGGGMGGMGGGAPPAGDPMAALGGMGGMGGEAPPMDPMAAMGGGGAPPADPTKMAAARKKRAELLQLVKSAKAYQKAGKFQFTEAKTAAERLLRNEIKKCFAEIAA